MFVLVRWVMGQQYNGGCEYNCEFHLGKTEWHHPISKAWDVGIRLCEAHHSLLKDRKKRYFGEPWDKTLMQMKMELKQMEVWKVLRAGFLLGDIDKC